MLSAAKVEDASYPSIHAYIHTGNEGDLRQTDDGGRDPHVDVHVVVRDEAVPRSVLSGEVELLPEEACHVGIP